MWHFAVSLLSIGAVPSVSDVATHAENPFSGTVGEKIVAFGRIEQCIFGPTIFVPDDGRGPFVIEADGFAVGETVFVTGYVGVFPRFCDNAFLPNIEIDGIEPAFADCGVLRITNDGTPRLFADDGRALSLTSDGGLPDGSSIFVRGVIQSKLNDVPRIIAETVDVCFSAVGRLERTADCTLLVTSNGETFAIENASNARNGAFVVAKGVALEDCAGFDCRGHCVAKNTIGRAFGGAGRITKVAPDGAVVAPNIVAGLAPLTIENRGAFGVGDDVFVLGSATRDAMGRPDHVRGNEIHAAFAGFGAITAIVNGRPRFSADDGRVFFLQTQGAATVDERIYVTGVIDNNRGIGDTRRLTFNTVNDTFFGKTLVQPGIECTPVAVIDGQGWSLIGLPSNVVNRAWIIEGIKNTPCDLICLDPCFGVTRAGVAVPAPGDMNCDGIVGVGDVNGFVLALTDIALYTELFPLCQPGAADVSNDGNISFADLNEFVELLTGQ